MRCLKAKNSNRQKKFPSRQKKFPRSGKKSTARV
jgi:hypothetical protein